MKSHSIAWRTELSMGRMLSRVDLEAAHVSTEHQLRQALMRVALAVPSGVMTLEKALLMCLKVWGVTAAIEETTGSQLPCVPSRGAVE